MVRGPEVSKEAERRARKSGTLKEPWGPGRGPGIGEEAGVREEAAALSRLAPGRPGGKTGTLKPGLAVGLSVFQPELP